jgi:NADH dehydrogenase FAD-containing subunit
MSRKKVLVLGGNFAGLTAALAVRHELHGDVDVRVVSASDKFLFNPSLIWLPFGKRAPQDITFPLAPTFESHGVDFVHAEATALDLDGRKVTTTGGGYDYDFLVIAAATEIADAKGYVKVRDTYQTLTRDEVYAVGIAVAVDVPWQTPTPVGVPKTGFPAERMAHVAARNIAAQIKGEQPSSRKAFGDIPAVCVMDAGNNGVIILADKTLPPREHGLLIPGPQAHAMKLGFEKYYLWKTRHGYVTLP